MSNSISQHSHDSDGNWDYNYDENFNSDYDGQQRQIAIHRI